MSELDNTVPLPAPAPEAITGKRCLNCRSFHIDEDAIDEDAVVGERSRTVVGERSRTVDEDVEGICRRLPPRPHEYGSVDGGWPRIEDPTNVYCDEHWSTTREDR